MEKVDWNIRKVGFESVLNKYEQYLRRNGLAENSVIRYRKTLKEFLTFAEEDHPSTEKACAFRNHLIDEHIAPSSVNTSCCALSNFYKMHGEEFKWKFLRVRNALPYFFTDEEVNRFFDACTNMKHLAMFQVLYYGCLRSTELCNLEDSDLDLENGTIHVRHGKGDKEAYVLISSRCINTLRKYLEIRPSITIEGKHYLFWTDYGKQWERVGLFKVFSYIKKRAKISSSGGVHTFGRHSSATSMIRKGADIRVVQEIMRHKDIKTTARYCHISDATKRMMYQKYMDSES